MRRTFTPLRWLLTCWFPLLCLSPACAQSPRKITTVPFEILSRRHPMPLVRVRLNDQMNALFAVDTGTNYNLLTEATAKKLKLWTAPAINGGEPVRMAGKPMDATTINAFRLGDFRLRVRMLVMEGNGLSQLFGRPIDGILGMAALRYFAVLFDFTNRQMTFWAHGRLTEAERGEAGMTDAFALPQANGHVGQFFVKGEFPETGEEAEFLVDTGASGTVVQTETASRLNLKPTGQAMSRSVYGVQKTHLARVPTLAFGGFRLTNHPISYLQQPRSDTPALLGLDVLQRCRVLLDTPQKTLYLLPQRK